MSLSLQQLPKSVDISLVQGDELPFQISFGRDITGYTIEVKVYVATLTVPTGGGVAAVTQGSVVFTPQTQVVNAATGLYGVVFTEENTALLTPTRSYRWYVRWQTPGGQTRTLVSGSVLPQVA